eukprot:1143590-Pelagomonas_calceolata.AAC.2
MLALLSVSVVALHIIGLTNTTSTATCLTKQKREGCTPGLPYNEHAGCLPCCPMWYCINTQCASCSISARHTTRVPHHSAAASATPFSEQSVVH